MKYEDEQTAVKQNIKHLQEVVAKEAAHEMNAEGFLKLVRKYTDIETLTPEILREFVNKIVVHHREVQFGETVQRVEIYYRFIGFIELPELSREQKQRLAQSFGCENATKKAG